MASIALTKAAAFLTFTPGPNNIMALVNANLFGFRKTVKFLLGVFTGFALIMLVCSYFNLWLFNLLPKVQMLMGIIGAVYMFYLAIIIMKSGEPEEKEGNAQLNSFLAGLTMQFVNPKVILYGITVISNFIITHYRSPLTLFLFSLFLAFVGLVAPPAGPYLEWCLSAFWPVIGGRLI